jgi:transcriptional regulator with XRE-family HTH domain
MTKNPYFIFVLPLLKLWLLIMNKTVKKPLNRIKIALAQKSKTNKWLAEKLNVKAPTVSQWCGNKVQPALETFYQIAEILDVEVRKLFVPTKEKDE